MSADFAELWRSPYLQALVLILLAWPAARFIEFGDSSLNFLLVGKVKNYRDRFASVDVLHTLVNKRFAEEGIDIPFPHRTVYHRVEDAELRKMKQTDSTPRV